MLTFVYEFKWIKFEISSPISIAENERKNINPATIDPSKILTDKRPNNYVMNV